MINKQHKLSIALSSLLLGLIQPTYSIAAHPDDKLEHFISLSLEDLIRLETSIATASKQTATKAPAVVTLITAEDIKATGATNLVDVLSGVPGLHIRASQFGNRPLIQFRGTKGTQTLLMIDGNSMVDLVWNFGIFWKGLPASVIERVEIIRGPGSARFGADASAGVINVITKAAEKIDYSEVGARAGSFNTQSAWMQHGDNWGDFQVAMSANISETDGHNPLIEIDGQTGRDQLFNTNVSQAPGKAQYGYRNTDVRFSIAKENWRLNTAYMSNSQVEIGLTGFGVLDSVTEGSDSRYNIDMFYNNADISENWELDIELRYQDLSYSSGAGFQERPPGFTDDTGTYPNGQINQQRSSERRVVFDASTLYNGFKKHAIRVGAGYTWQDLYSVEHLVNFGTGADGNDLPAGGPLVDLSGTPFAFAPENTRQISHLYIQDIWAISNAWELTAGARYDNYSDFGNTVNPRLALVWQSTEKLTTKLLYGQAFRPPSYLELFDETSFTKPNPNLEPEQSQTWDLSFNYAAKKNIQLTLNLFSFNHTDIITNSNIVGQFQNNGDHHIKGLELETRWQASKDVNLYANYTYRNQDESRFRAIQEADEEAYFRADWGLLPKWNWNFQASYIGERSRNTSGANPDTRAPVKAYVVTNTTLRYATTNSWEFAVSIRNLFDTDAREFTGRGIPNDLPLPERSAYAEIRYKF